MNTRTEGRERGERAAATRGLVKRGAKEGKKGRRTVTPHACAHASQRRPLSSSPPPHFRRTKASAAQRGSHSHSLSLEPTTIPFSLRDEALQRDPTDHAHEARITRTPLASGQRDIGSPLPERQHNPYTPCFSTRPPHTCVTPKPRNAGRYTHRYSLLDRRTKQAVSPGD